MAQAASHGLRFPVSGRGRGLGVFLGLREVSFLVLMPWGRLATGGSSFFFHRITGSSDNR
jgi:hypothetical protein